MTNPICDNLNQQILDWYQQVTSLNSPGNSAISFSEMERLVLIFNSNSILSSETCKNPSLSGKEVYYQPHDRKPFILPHQGILELCRRRAMLEKPFLTSNPDEFKKNILSNMTVEEQKNLDLDRKSYILRDQTYLIIIKPVKSSMYYSVECYENGEYRRLPPYMSGWISDKIKKPRNNGNGIEYFLLRDIFELPIQSDSNERLWKRISLFWTNPQKPPAEAYFENKKTWAEYFYKRIVLEYKLNPEKRKELRIEIIDLGKTLGKNKKQIEADIEYTMTHFVQYLF